MYLLFFYTICLSSTFETRFAIVNAFLFYLDTLLLTDL